VYHRGGISLVFALLLIAWPDPAFAHGFGQRQDIPLPFWLYLFGMNAVIFATFVMVALSFEDRRASYQYPRVDLLRIGLLRAASSSKTLLVGLRLLSVALFLLVIFSGFFGAQAPEDNFAPTFVWITWWVGLSYFTALVGNIWPLVNPWKVIFEWAGGFARRLGFDKSLEIRKPYQVAWGVWPAVALYGIFAWVEIVFQGSSTPSNIALFTLLYSMLTWTGMTIFGKDAWLRSGEVFSVYFGFLGRFAPTEVRVTDTRLCKDCGDACWPAGGGCVNCYECFARAAPEAREINLRPPAIGLALGERVATSRMVFVIVVLASVTYDSLLETSPWTNLVRLASVTPMLGLCALPLIFLAVYLAFMKISQLAGGGRVPFGRLATAYAYTLVPIAIVYQMAHYYTFLLVQGQAIIALFSDPLGRGWNLFGTGGYQIHAGIVDAAFVWYSQVALIIAGHVVAVYLAHVVALRLLEDPVRAARSQYPMAVLMILYTILGLWILSQPITG
jgi:hypothetical protein